MLGNKGWMVALAAVVVHAQWPQAHLWTNRLLSALAWPSALAAMWALVALLLVVVRRMHEPPLRKAMLLMNETPVLLSSRRSSTGPVSETTPCWRF